MCVCVCVWGGGGGCVHVCMCVCATYSSYVYTHIVTLSASYIPELVARGLALHWENRGLLNNSYKGLMKSGRNIEMIAE